MSGSSRKRTSKWDLREEHQFEPENVPDDYWLGKAGMSFHDKESEPEWLSPEVAGSNSSKWSDPEANDLLKSKRLPSREPLLGSRGSHGRGSNRNLEATVAWEGDGSYSMRMSPGLDDWRQQSRSRSPKNALSRSFRGRSRSKSRSRSRSPVRGIRRESGFHDRSRSRGASAQLCKNFAAGRCRRGNNCQFLHQGSQHYEDSWESRHRKGGDSKFSTPHDSRDYPSRMGRSTAYCTDFVKGTCRRGASCRYAHHGASEGFSKGSVNDVIRERENHRRNRDASFERGSEPESRRGVDIPCKFFAAGNCRNGRNCRFSHHSQTYTSPERRSRDDRWGLGCNSDDVDQSWVGPKWSHTEDKNGKLGDSEPMFTGWSRDDTRWGHLDNEKKTGGDAIVGHKAVESNKKEGHPLKEENAGASTGVSESRGDEKWLVDTDMSPDWNYRVQSSNHVVKEEHGQISQGSQSLGYDTSLVTRGQDITQEASGQMHDTAAIVQPMINEKPYIQQNHNLREDGTIVPSCNEKSAIEKTVNITPGKCFDQNGRSSSTLPLLNLNTVRQNLVATPITPSRGGTKKKQQNLVVSPERKSIIKPDFVVASTSQVNPGISPSQNAVSSEKLTQITNLSASLAQFFGNGQQLPQLYAALNPEGPVEPVSAAFIQPDPAVGSQQQYDPICDSVEPKKPDVSNNSPGFSLNPTGQKRVADGKPDVPLTKKSPSSFLGGSNGGDFLRTGSAEEPNYKSHQSNQLKTGANSEVVMESNGVGAEESKKAQEEKQNAQEDGALENVYGDGGADEGKKNKDVKGLRAFKFSLVEFVKELLKPNWKEGHISKDAYKTIVKKVVDKVTGTMQGPNIPQTQEKIDQYLSFSKPKLTKLVQAYVEKSQKG